MTVTLSLKAGEFSPLDFSCDSIQYNYESVLDRSSLFLNVQGNTKNDHMVIEYEPTREYGFLDLQIFCESGSESSFSFKLFNREKKKFDANVDFEVFLEKDSRLKLDFQIAGTESAVFNVNMLVKVGVHSSYSVSPNIVLKDNSILKYLNEIIVFDHSSVVEDESVKAYDSSNSEVIRLVYQEGDCTEFKYSGVVELNDISLFRYIQKNYLYGENSVHENLITSVESDECNLEFIPKYFNHDEHSNIINEHKIQKK